jgi:Mrp family chromosome partitioning ATPase
VFNSILGLVLGLMIGVGAAFLLRLRDKRLHTEHDAVEVSGLPVLGTVREDVLGTLPFSSTNPTEAEHNAISSFGILRRRLELSHPTTPPRTIAVVSGVPEEGKSTVSAALAAAFASVGRQTLLLECDLRRPTLAARHGVSPSPGLADLLEGRANANELIRTLALPHAGSSGAPNTLAYIPAGTSTRDADDLLTSDEFKRFLAKVKSVYDAVIIDTPPLLSVADGLEILPLVDAYLLCTRLSHSTGPQIVRTLKMTSGLPALPAGIIVTGTARRDESELGYAYGYSYGHKRNGPEPARSSEPHGTK